MHNENFAAVKKTDISSVGKWMQLDLITLSKIQCMFTQKKKKKP